MELNVKIDVGNDAMTSGVDLANALRKVAKDLVQCYGAESVPEPISAQRIGDMNGNRVGSWWIEGTA